MIHGIPRHDIIVMAGDFNAKVGRDSDTWRGTIGKFGWGDMNDSREKLLQFCATNDLKILNTFFEQKKPHRQ